jgi:hypothetical protein
MAVNKENRESEDEGGKVIITIIITMIIKSDGSRRNLRICMSCLTM